MSDLNSFFNSNLKIKEIYYSSDLYSDYIEKISGKCKYEVTESQIQKEILNKASRILKNRFSTDILSTQLKNYPLISVADHHGLLNYKLLYNSNILFYHIIRKLNLPYIVVLATGDIPLKNISFPRGFYFKNQKFNFFNKKESTIPVHLINSVVNTGSNKTIDDIVLNFKSLNITSEEKKFLDHLFYEGLNFDKSSENYGQFSDQLSYLNFKIWKYYFSKNLRDSIPDIIYIQSNQIVKNIFKEEISKDNSLIAKILFDSSVRNLVLKNFQGIQSCWSKHSGTHFFWGISAKKNIFPLYCSDDNTLVGKDLTLSLNKEDIIESLDENKIRLSNFFHYLMTTFIGGYCVLGGFNQLEYLPQMQTAHIKTLKKLGMSDLADQFASRITDGFICGMLPFQFDSGIDLIWHYNSTNGKFNGNLDRGITQEQLDEILAMPMKTLIETGVSTMLEIVK
ncbi:MAG: hypothetical protein MJB14_19645 [Spirochaetes bacterium]|nr:hypothetical protein [Spirochaetota bacterium]